MTEQPAVPSPPPIPAGPQPGQLVDRFLARLVDGIGFAVVYGILYAIFGAIFLRGFSNSLGELFLFYAFLSILSTALYIGYFAYLESTRGATIGKQVLKLKVVGPDGVSHPTFEQAAKRSAFQAVNLISIVPVVGLFFGPLLSIAAVVGIAITINNDPARRQGWHDTFAGGTQVLKIG